MTRMTPKIKFRNSPLTRSSFSFSEKSKNNILNQNLKYSHIIFWNTSKYKRMLCLWKYQSKYWIIKYDLHETEIFCKIKRWLERTFFKTTRNLCFSGSFTVRSPLFSSTSAISSRLYHSQHEALSLRERRSSLRPVPTLEDHFIRNCQKYLGF